MKIKTLTSMLFLILMALSLEAQEVYVPNIKGGIDPLTRAVTMGTKTGNGMLALYGKKITSSLVLDGKSSTTFLPRTSTMFYVFTPKNLPVQGWKLVPLKSKKDHRELPFMKTGAYTGSKTSLDDIQLLVTKLTDEVFELRPIGDVKNGEYAIAYIENGVPTIIYDFRVESNMPPYPSVSHDVVLAEFAPSPSTNSLTDSDDFSNAIIRWYFDSDPRGARIFYRVISNVPSEVKNTNESYLTTTPLEETKALSIPGITYENSNNVVIEIKVSKRGYEEQIKRYNVRQVLDQQEISGFFELVEK
ncbi:MAG: hypothetical protein J1F05_05985 [Muribaculaceae bacterium]|nr:hypothetical protein [Muribaculaceae bacterium]